MCARLLHDSDLWLWILDTLAGANGTRTRAEMHVESSGSVLWPEICKDIIETKLVNRDSYISARSFVNVLLPSVLDAPQDKDIIPEDTVWCS